MCNDIQLPSVINEYPTRAYIKSMDGIKMVGVALKVARNIHMRCKLAEAQNWKCCWCGIHCIPEPHHKHSATIEHVHPRSLGGKDDWDNYAMACARCNHKRGTTSVEDFMAGVLTHLPKKEDKVARAERLMRKKIRKYRNHIIRLNDYGWVRNGIQYCPDKWLSTLNIPEEKREELKELVDYSGNENRTPKEVFEKTAWQRALVRKHIKRGKKIYTQWKAGSPHLDFDTWVMTVLCLSKKRYAIKYWKKQHDGKIWLCDWSKHCLFYSRPSIICWPLAWSNDST